MSGEQAEVSGHGSGVRGHRDARAGRWQVTLVKIVGHRATSRFVRSSKARTRAVAQEGSVRTLPRTRHGFAAVANAPAAAPFPAADGPETTTTSPGCASRQAVPGLADPRPGAASPPDTARERTGPVQARSTPPAGPATGVCDAPHGHRQPPHDPPTPADTPGSAGLTPITHRHLQTPERPPGPLHISRRPPANTTALALRACREITCVLQVLTPQLRSDARRRIIYRRALRGPFTMPDHAT